MIVAEMMSQDVRCCRPTDTLSAAAQIMWERDCGAVPVADGDGRVVGMITDRDICMAAHLRGQRLDECLVGEIMSRPPVACRPGDAIEKAEGLMREHRIRRLVVVDEHDHLAGVLSMNDLVLAAPIEGKRRRDVRSEDVMSTLATISQHRRQQAATAGA